MDRHIERGKHVGTWFHALLSCKYLDEAGLSWKGQSTLTSAIARGHIEVWFGLLGVNVSATVRVIARFGLLGPYASATARGHSEVWFVRA